MILGPDTKTLVRYTLTVFLYKFKEYVNTLRTLEQWFGCLSNMMNSSANCSEPLCASFSPMYKATYKNQANDKMYQRGGMYLNKHI